MCVVIGFQYLGTPWAATQPPPQSRSQALQCSSPPLAFRAHVPAVKGVMREAKSQEPSWLVLHITLLLKQTDRVTEGEPAVRCAERRAEIAAP